MDFTLAHVNPPFDLFMLIPSIVMKYCNSMSCCGLLHHVIYLPRLLLSAYIMFNYICRCPCCPFGNGWHPQTMHLKRITPPRKCNFVYDDHQCNRLTLITVDSELLWLVERISVTVKCTIPLNITFGNIDREIDGSLTKLYLPTTYSCSVMLKCNVCPNYSINIHHVVSSQ